MKNRLKEMRYKRMMTKSELARRSGISRTTIWMLENNPEKAVTSDTMAALAKALEMPVERIFFAKVG